MRYPDGATPVLEDGDLERVKTARAILERLRRREPRVLRRRDREAIAQAWFCLDYTLSAWTYFPASDVMHGPPPVEVQHR